MLHAISELKKMYGNTISHIITILPTTPLNKPGDFDRGIYLFQKWGCDILSPMILKRETVVAKRIGMNRCRTVIFAKKYQYVDQSSGWSITRPEWYEAYCADQKSDLDADLDLMENWTRTEGYFIPNECWQYADVDTLEEFQLGEVLMEHYILKGNGSKVYEDYRNDRTEIDAMIEMHKNSMNEFDIVNKMIKEEKELEIDLSKYGNINQQG